MECKRIQEWLMTDHLDGELTSTESAEVQQHVEGCPACREFMEIMSGIAAAPFKGLAELRPDPIVWQKVREMIATEEERSEGWLKKIERLLTPVLRPLPAFRVVFVTAMVLMVFVLAKAPFSPTEPAYAYVEEQMAFMGELQTGNPDALSGDLNDYAIPLDEIVR